MKVCYQGKVYAISGSKVVRGSGEVTMPCTGLPCLMRNHKQSMELDK